MKSFMIQLSYMIGYPSVNGDWLRHLEKEKINKDGSHIYIVEIIGQGGRKLKLNEVIKTFNFAPFCIPSKKHIINFNCKITDLIWFYKSRESSR